MVAALNVWSRAAEYAYPDQERYLMDPVGWSRDRAGIHLWSKQRDVIQSVRDYPETAVHSCHSTGKSLGAAVTVCWWLDVHPPGSAFAVTTAPSGAQVKAILWREISKIHKNAGLAGRTNLTEWYIGDEMVAFGRKPSEYNPTSFQGIHAEFVLVVLDEACGIPAALWDAASSLTSNESSRTLAIGNPDDPHSHFAKMCKPSSTFNVIHIGWKHTPNATGEDVPDKVRKHLISKSWRDSKAIGWGEKSALFTSKVNGEFPVDSEKGVVPHSWAVKCRYVQLPEAGVRVAGLDVGGGGDLTVLRERVGARAGREKTWQEPDPNEVIGEIVLCLQEWDIQRVVVDVIGIGWALGGRLRELSSRHNPHGDTTHSAEVVGFNAAQASTQPKRFINKRSEMWWEIGRERSRLQTWDLEMVDDDTLSELTEPEYKVLDSYGKIQVERREDIVKKLGHSPDRATALLMAFWDGDTHEITPLATAEEMRSRGFVDQQGLGIAGPKPQRVESPPDPARQAEQDLMREIGRGRPL
jgi:hypothetical protein